MGPLRTAARAMLGAMFIRGGYDAIRHPEALAERAKPVTDRVAPLIEAIDPDLPTDATTLVRLNGVAQLTGGVLLATGVAPRPGAAILAVSLVPTTLAGHRFWEYSNPQQRAQQEIHFLKNLGMLGGLVLAALDTEGRPGLAWRAGHLADHLADQAGRSARQTGKSARRAGKSARRAARNTRRAARTTATRAGRFLPG
jgi:putative oxidoreductase